LRGGRFTARALFAGAPNIERVDRLVQSIAAQKGMRNAALDETVALVDAKLEQNRKRRHRGWPITGQNPVAAAPFGQM
jgi:hypothetical protein